MLIAFLLLASAMNWVPARWMTADVSSLELVKDTPINCLLLERPHWDRSFAEAARNFGIATLGIVTPTDKADTIDAAQSARLTGVVLEGTFEPAAVAELHQAARDANLEVVDLRERTSIDLNDREPVVGTYQGVWPGVHTTEDGAAKAAPTGAPWIDTNSGFLRFVHATSDATCWIGIRPPTSEIVKPTRYLQAIGDAAMVGARWVVAVTPEFSTRLLAREEAALAAWKRIGADLRFWEQHRAWTRYPPAGQLALIQDIDSGGLLSNGIIDMLCARHTPLRTVPRAELGEPVIEGTSTVLNINPPALDAEQQEFLRGFARHGGTLLTAPPGWEMQQNPGQFTVSEKDVDTLEKIWHGINMTIGRQNLGVRLFNVATMRSELVSAPDGGQVLHLLNYSDYPMENITVRPILKFTRATLYLPDVEPADLEIFENGEIDIERVASAAIVVLEGPAGQATATGGH